MIYKRNCPECGRTCEYRNPVSYARALKGNSICRNCVDKTSMRKNQVSILLNEDLITYYWMGFILADAHISEKFRLKVVLNKIDIEHLKKLQSYLKIEKLETRGEYCSINAMDKKNLKELVEKYDIHHNKTYNPPLLSFYKNLSEDKFLALVIGIIDGDGCIRKQYKRNDWKICIKMHSSWVDFLNLISDRLLNKKIADISNNGYARINLTQVKTGQKLKKFALENKLPLLERKWDKVDLDYITFYDKANDTLEKIKKIANKDITIQDICNELNLKYSCVYRIIKKYKIEHKKLKNYVNNKY